MTGRDGYYLDHRSAVADVISRYAQAVDAANIDAAIACFSEDAHLEYEAGAIVLDGHDAMRRFWQGSLVAPSTHLLANVLIEIAAPVASAEVSGVAFVTRNAGVVTVRGLHYSLRLVQRRDRWTIANLNHHCHWQFAAPIGSTRQERPADHLPIFGQGT